MTDEEQAVKAYLDTLPNKKVIELFGDRLVNEHTTYKDLYSIKKEVDEKLTKKVHKHQAVNLKPRFDNSMMYDALNYQLENKATPVEVFQYVQDLYNMDTEWLKEAKHTTLREEDRKEVAKAVINNNPEVVQEISDKGLSVKEAIVNGRSPTRQIRKVSDYISLSDRVDLLESKVKEIDLRQTITECRLESLENQTNPQKQIALKLKLEGKTQREIAEILDLNIRTIGRWLKKDNKAMS
jgi:hypothetical protein